jgi:hypothetical protein
LESVCDHIIESNNFSDIKIISGCARGADRLGEKYAINRGYLLERCPANWGRYGKAAGFKRNDEMANIADVLIAFWDGVSSGTEHMIFIAKERKLQVFVYEI